MTHIWVKKRKKPELPFLKENHGITEQRLCGKMEP